MKSQYKNPFIISALISIMIIVIVIATNIPLGIKSDWSWKRIENTTFSFYGFAIFLLILIIGTLITFLTDFHIPEKKRIAKITMAILISELIPRGERNRKLNALVFYKE